MNKPLGLNLTPEKAFAMSSAGPAACKERMQSRVPAKRTWTFGGGANAAHAVIKAGWMKAER